MPLTFSAKGGSGDFKSAPAGSHIAICNMVADLGMQPGSAAFPAPKHQLYIRWEIPEERVEHERDGKKTSGPIVIGKTYTASMHEKATLRKDLEGWRSKKFTDEEASIFDVSAVLGKPCMISVVEKVVGDKVYSNIAGLSALPRGVQAPRAENPLLYYAEEMKTSFGDLPEWIQKKIQGQIKAKQDESDSDHGYYAESTAITDDDIPF